jgi:recombinational DNA repair protein RecR
MNKKELLDLLNQVRNPNDDNYFSKDWIAESILKLKKCESCGNFCDNVEDKICKNCNRDNRINEIL